MIMLSFVCCYGVSFSAQGGQNGWSEALVWNLHPILQKELHFTLKIFEKKKIDARTSSFLFFWNTADFIPLSCFVLLRSVCLYHCLLYLVLERFFSFF